MNLIISILIALLFFTVLTMLFFFRNNVLNWCRRNKKKVLGLGVTIAVVTAGAGYILSNLGDEQPPFIDPAAFIWNPGSGYGSIPRWEINKTYAKQFLKDNMKWRLQASPNNETWYDANELLHIGLDWNELDCSYKVTLTLNTTNAPQSLFYRFDLACNKSLKQFFEIDGYEWTLTIPANNTMDYTLRFNWSDIKPLIQNGKVWFDRGVKNNFFWFRVQTVNKINPGLVFVVDPVYGVMPAAVTSSYEWNSITGIYVDMLQLGTSEYYLQVYTGPSNDGWANTTRVYNDNGTIKKQTIDYLEWDTSNGFYPSLCHVSGDIYAVSYCDATNIKVKTFSADDADGLIGAAFIDTLTLSTHAATYSDICKVSGNMFAVAYANTSATGVWLQTVYIDNSGIIPVAVNDTQRVNAASVTGANGIPGIESIDSDTVIVSYAGSGTDGYMVTYDINAATGAITDAFKSEWEFDTTFGSYSHVKRISGNIYAVTYKNGASDPAVKTLTIATDGTITKSWIDTLTFSETDSYYINPVFIVNNLSVYGITYRCTDDDGMIKTFNMSADGTIGASAIDSLEFDAADNMYFAHVEWVNKSWYLIVYTSTGVDGWACTVSIATNWASPIFSAGLPANNSAGQILTPTCSITVNDTNADTMSITFAENSTGDWINRQTNGSVANGTYRWTFSQATNGPTKYWWKVYANDGQHNVSECYCFTTLNPNTAPTNTYVGAWDILKNNEWEFNITQVKAPPWTLNISISDPDGDRMNWTIYHNDGGTWKVVAFGTNSPNATNTTTNTTWIDEYGTNYSISVNITDGIVWFNNSRWFTTNNPPDITDYFPTNEATGVELTPRCSITIDDDDGDTMDVLWEEYQIPVYVDVQTNSTVGNGTYTYDYVNATAFSTTYGWRINVDDGIDETELTLSFRTRAQYATSVSLSGLTSDWNVTWNGTTPTGSTNVHTVFINNSGDRYETVEINIVVNDTMFVDNIYFWAMWLNDTVNNTQIYTDNITVWVSDDNATWGILQHDVGNGMGCFPHTMGYLHWNWTTEPDGVEAFPYTPINGYVISSNTTLYARYQLNITDTAVEGIYYNLTAWEISVVNESSGDGIGVINSASHTCKAKVEQGWINTAPVQSNPAPANNSYDNTRTIMLNITVGDIDDATQDMSITWQTNSSGSWVTFGTNNTVNNGTYRQPMENFTIPGTKYWWRIILTDNEGGWDNDTYCLTMNNDTVWYKSSGYNCYLEIDSLSFDPIVVSDSYVMFNTTDFKVTSTNRTNISIIFINTSITDATAGNLLVDFCAHNTGGIVWFNISGFTYTVNYSVYKNSVLLGYDVADVNGDISFSDTINGYTPRYQIYFNIAGSVSYNTTIRNTGIDYFVWLGGNTTAVNVASIITGFNEAAEYIAIWNESQAAWDNTNGLWAKYYGDGSGDNFDIQTFDVVRCYLTDSGTQNFDMTSNPDMNYTKSYNITLSNLTRNKGFNYTGYNRVSSTTLDTINSSIGIPEGYYVGRWNETTYTWDFWISGFSTVDYTVERWAVVMTKVDGTRWWNT